VRVIEADAQRARHLADSLPEARVYHATGFDRDFLRRERIGRATAAVFAMRDDAQNLYAAILARNHGVPFTIAVLEEPGSAEVFDTAGVDAAIDPGAETAQVMMRFARDPRTRQIAMLEDERLQVLDITVRAESALVARPLADLPATSSVIGAIIRDDQVLFPHGQQRLRAGDRVIVLAEARRAATVERTL
jgi:trk system potassium uptake protein TrkA